MEKAPEKDARDVYFVSPLADVLVAGGGLSVIVFVIMVLCGYVPGTTKGTFRAEWAISIAFSLQMVVNWPHFAATSFRLYQSYDRMMQFPKTSFLSPVLVVGGLAWSMVDANVANWYAKLFITWSGYHFCAQTKGITLLYARRLGVNIDPLARWLIVIVTHTPWLFAITRAEGGENLGPFYSLTIPRGLPFGIAFPFAWAPALEWTANAFYALGCIAFVLLVVLVMAREGRVLPIATAAPMIAQTLWFGPWGSGTAVFNEFVPFFHSLQYMIIAWLFQLKEESAQPGFLVGLPTVLFETAKWLAFIIPGGLALFWLWPHAFSWTGYPLQHSLGCVNAAIQIHHFFVDGVIWKIRDPRTRAMLGGNLFDLAGVPRGPAVSELLTV
jgi:hypothetical protein